MSECDGEVIRELQKRIAKLRAELVTAKEEIARLRDALERNWIHDAWCESFYGEPCNCMDAALRDGWG